MAFKYRGHERKVEDIVRNSKQQGGSYDSYIGGGLPQYKPKEGECQIRILPPTWDLENEKYGNGWQVSVYVHYKVGPDEAAYLCRDKGLGERCPVCEERTNMTPKEADDTKLVLRNLVWLIDRNNTKAGPQIWAMPPSVFRDINARSVDKKTGKPILIDDPEEGYDVMFTRVGSDMKTKYEAIEVDRDPSPVHDNEKKQQQWIDFIEEHPIPDAMQFYEEDYIEKVLLGKTDRRARDEDADDDDEGATNGRRAPRSSRRAAAADDDDDDKPRGRSRRTAADDDGDEEEKPRRGASRRAAAEEDDDDIPSERPGRRSARAAEDADEDEPERKQVVRRKARTEPEEDDDEAPKGRKGRAAAAEEDDDDSPSKQARGKLANMRERRRSA